MLFIFNCYCLSPTSLHVDVKLRCDYPATLRHHPERQFLGDIDGGCRRSRHRRRHPHRAHMLAQPGPGPLQHTTGGVGALQTRKHRKNPVLQQRKIEATWAALKEKPVPNGAGNALRNAAGARRLSCALFSTRARARPTVAAVLGRNSAAAGA